MKWLVGGVGWRSMWHYDNRPVVVLPSTLSPLNHRVVSGRGEGDDR